MFIVKVGGGKSINWDYVCEDLASLLKKEEVILVHGASHKRDEIAEKLGQPTRTITSPSGFTSVFTDKIALEIFLMAYAGLVNKQIVAKLQRLSVNAVGLSGVDGRLWEGKRKSNTLVKNQGKTKLLRNNFTGRVERVNTELLQTLREAGFFPVVCAPGISYEGEIINVDNDWAAALMAKELKAKKLVFLFEAPGLLRNLNNEKTLIRKINKKNIEAVFKFAQGRMKKKILGAKIALEGGVREIYFADGRVKNPIQKALSGKGTVIK